MKRSLEQRLAEPAPERPLWQRIVLPFVGLVCVVVGIIGWLMPVIPGAPLAVLGIPFLFCFSRRAEQGCRDRCVRVVRWIKQRTAGLRARWRARHHRS